MSARMVLDLATSATHGNGMVCFAGTSQGLAYSDSGGADWHDAYSRLALTAPLPTSAIALSPDFGNDHTMFAGVPGAVLRSTDGGQHWRAAALPTPPPFVSTLVVSPGFLWDGVVLAGTLEDGVFRSEDGGVTWTSWNFGLLDLRVLCLSLSPDFAEDDTLYVGTDSGLYRSTNGGRAWRETGLPCEWGPVLSISVGAGAAHDVVWVGTEQCGLVMSRDGGHTWQPRKVADVAAPVNAIVLHPAYPDIPSLLIDHGGRLLLSSDDGKSWAVWQSEGNTSGAALTAIALNAHAPFPSAWLGFSDGKVTRIGDM